eukprot:TRINITY_DN12625_c0_g1_i2.p1 TRINITY_DN12625_c0_g1~~TRINITY_DN12625_c0_g1_i2.p1  ORF type:complete len:981 (-),score=135.80 TRINITY_DN12625_c0_g1_i2:88-3030(-)
MPAISHEDEDELLRDVVCSLVETTLSSREGDLLEELSELLAPRRAKDSSPDDGLTKLSRSVSACLQLRGYVKDSFLVLTSAPNLELVQKIKCDAAQGRVSFSGLPWHRAPKPGRHKDSRLLSVLHMYRRFEAEKLALSSEVEVFKALILNLVSDLDVGDWAMSNFDTCDDLELGEETPTLQKTRRLQKACILAELPDWDPVSEWTILANETHPNMSRADFASSGYSVTAREIIDGQTVATDASLRTSQSSRGSDDDVACSSSDDLSIRVSEATRSKKWGSIRRGTTLVTKAIEHQSFGVPVIVGRSVKSPTTAKTTVCARSQAKVVGTRRSSMLRGLTALCTSRTSVPTASLCDTTFSILSKPSTEARDTERDYSSATRRINHNRRCSGILCLTSAMDTKLSIALRNVSELPLINTCQMLEKGPSMQARSPSIVQGITEDRRMIPVKVPLGQAESQSMGCSSVSQNFALSGDWKRLGSSELPLSLEAEEGGSVKSKSVSPMRPWSTSVNVAKIKQTEQAKVTPTLPASKNNPSRDARRTLPGLGGKALGDRTVAKAVDKVSNAIRLDSNVEPALSSLCSNDIFGVADLAGTRCENASACHQDCIASTESPSANESGLAQHCPIVGSRLVPSKHSSPYRHLDDVRRSCRSTVPSADDFAIETISLTSPKTEGVHVVPTTRTEDSIREKPIDANLPLEGSEVVPCSKSDSRRVFELEPETEQPPHLSEEAPMASWLPSNGEQFQILRQVVTKKHSQTHAEFQGRGRSISFTSRCTEENDNDSAEGVTEEEKDVKGGGLLVKKQKGSVERGVDVNHPVLVSSSHDGPVLLDEPLAAFSTSILGSSSRSSKLPTTQGRSPNFATALRSGRGRPKSTNSSVCGVGSLFRDSIGGLGFGGGGGSRRSPMKSSRKPRTINIVADSESLLASKACRVARDQASSPSHVEDQQPFGSFMTANMSMTFADGLRSNIDLHVWDWECSNTNR